jgi:undecaprenyl diphosphate synthase
MSQSALHVAIIMDGNGRWAQARGRRREWGHRAGARRVRRLVEIAPDHGIGTLTLYAFSSDNWKRPSREVNSLFRLFRGYLKREVAHLKEQGVRLQVVGRRDRLPEALVAAIEEAEGETVDGRRLTLRLAVDYSSRAALLEVARRCAREGFPLNSETFAHMLGSVSHAAEPAPDVDLLIRTGGERRLSDFLLWECAYAELLFTDRMWPDFAESDLASAMRDYRARDRRYGRVAEAV